MVGGGSQRGQAPSGSPTRGVVVGLALGLACPVNPALPAESPWQTAHPLWASAPASAGHSNEGAPLRGRGEAQVRTLRGSGTR